MAIKEQANNASLTGGVTEFAENPNEPQVAGIGSALLDIFLNAKPPVKPKPNVADSVPTPISEESILKNQKITDVDEEGLPIQKKQPDAKSYRATSDAFAKENLSPEGYARWKEQGKQAEKITPDANVMTEANKALGELDPNTPFTKEREVYDNVESIYNVDQAILSTKKGVDFNFEKLETGDDVLELIDRMSAIYKDPTKAAKRGIITNKETLANASDLLADELGLTRKLFKQGRGATMNAEEMLAVRQILVKSAERLEDLTSKIASGRHTPEDLLKFRRQMAIHAGIQMKAKAAQTEIARALQAFNIPVGLRGPEVRADMVQEMLQESGGAELAVKLAKGYQKTIKEGGRAAGNKYINGAWHTKATNIFNEIYINGLLSWSTTHLKNLIATPVFQVYQLPEEILAGMYGTIERGVRKSTGLARGSDDGVFVGQAFARIYGWSRAWKEAWLVAGKTFRTEQPASFGQKIDHAKYKAIDAETLGSNNFWSGPVDMLGKVIRLPGRGLQTADDFWKTIAQRGELHSQAYIAKKTSLRNGDDAVTANDNAMMLLVDPKAIGDDLAAKANYATLTDDPGIIGKMTNAVQSTVIGRILLPFARVPTNAVIRAAERVPWMAALNPRVYGDLIGKRGPAARQKALGRLTWTAGTMYMFSEWAATGRITGSMPRSEKQRNLLPPGWQPYSIVFRDQTNKEDWLDSEGDLLPLYDVNGLPNGPLKYIKYAGLEPVGAVLGIAADVVERQRRTDDPLQRENIATAAAMATMDYFQNLPFLQSIGDITKAIEYSNLDYLTSGPLGNMIGIVPLPYASAQRTIARGTGDQTTTKISSDLSYYTLEEVEAMRDADGNVPYDYVGRLKGGAGEWFNRSIDDAWKLQTKDSLVFGSNENELAIQYDVLGNPKVSNTARFDVRPGEALWNLVTSFDVKRGDKLEWWQKELYRIGMPLVTKRKMLAGKIRLTEKQMSDWTNLAKNEVLVRKSGERPLVFRDALIKLVTSSGYDRLPLHQKQNKVKNLENEYYETAINALLSLEGNDELRDVYDDYLFVRDKLRAKTY